MPSMGYCKFENTCRDMQQCVDHIEDQRRTSTREVMYAKRLYELAEKLVEHIDDLGIRTEDDD